MAILYLLVSIGFFLWVIRNGLFWVYLWQVKEYRLDRVFVHIRETVQGRSLFYSVTSLIKLALIVVYLFLVSNDSYLWILYLLIAGIYFWQGFWALKDFFSQRTRLPAFTPKALCIIVLVYFVLIILYSIPLVDQFVWLLLIDRIVYLLVAFFVLLLNIPTKLYIEWMVDRATKKREKFPNVLVVGITGSYGKSSTKEFATQILKKKFTVVATPGFENTAFGIAKTILTKLTKKTDVMILEMATYKKGEISALCEMSMPKVGVITAVNARHSLLSGGLISTAQAKYELIESLPKDGFALFNGNQENATKLFTKTRKKKVLYKVQKSADASGADIVAYNAHMTTSGVLFSVKIKNQTIKLSMPLLGLHTVSNVLPGIYLAHFLGMSTAEIKQAVAKLKPLKQTMKKIDGPSGATFIDDTHNANPESVDSALDYMKLYKGKKVLVLQPLIELGKNANEEHIKLGRAVAKTCDYLLLTNRNFFAQITQGIEEVNGKCFAKIGSSQEIANFLKENITGRDIVVFEGREAAFVMREFE